MLFDLLAKTKIYLWIVKYILPHLNFRLWGYPKYDLGAYFAIRDNMLSNPDATYIFVGVDKCALSYKLHKLFTKAKWNHTGFAFIERGEICIAHMLGTGFHFDTALNYMREVDEFEILCVHTPWAKTKAKILDLVKECQGFDFWFDLSSKNYLFCSELVFDVLKDELYCFKQRNVHNLFSCRQLFEPDDVYQAAKSFRAKWDHV